MARVVAKATLFGDEAVVWNDIIDYVFFVVRVVRLWWLYRISAEIIREF